MRKWVLSLLPVLLLTGCGAGVEIQGNGILEEAPICLDPANLRSEGPWEPGESRVIFGQFGGEPITWRILPPSDTQGLAEDGLLLDCETSLCLKAFDGDFHRNEGQIKSPNEWKGSDLELWLNGDFLENSFTTEEIAAVALTALRGEDTPYSAGDWAFKFTDFTAENRVFLLSALEAKTLYGSNGARAKSGVSPNWWLRSKFDTGGNGAASIHIDGHICSNSIQNFGVGVSPALNVRTADILFATEIQPSLWKLTLKDPGLSIREKNQQNGQKPGKLPYSILQKKRKSIIFP